MVYVRAEARALHGEPRAQGLKSLRKDASNAFTKRVEAILFTYGLKHLVRSLLPYGTNRNREFAPTSREKREIWGTPYFQAEGSC